MSRWCPPGAARSGCGMAGPGAAAGRRRRPGSATDGCCGWPRRWPGTRPCPGRTSCTTATFAVTDALALALKGAGGTQAVTAHEIRDRVRARFPALPPLPDRPRLDQLIADAGLGLVYDDAERGYRWPTRAADTKGLASRQATVTASARPAAGQRRPVRAPPGRERAPPGRSSPSASTPTAPTAPSEALTGRFGAAVVDVTQVLIEAMRAQAAEVGLPWDLVQAADAAPPGSRDAAGLAALVQRSLPAVEAAIDRGARRRARRDAPGPAHRDRAARPVRPPGHAEPVDRPGRPAPAGHLGARPAAARQPGRHHRQAARCRSPPPGSSSASTPSGSIRRVHVPTGGYT